MVKGLKFYENDAQVLLHHKVVMNDLIVSLHTEHSRFRHSCSVLLRGLVDDKELEDFLDRTTKEEWEKELKQGLEKGLRKKLGPGYYAYTETMRQIQEKLEKLEKVVGMGKQQVRFRCFYFGKLLTRLIIAMVRKDRIREPEDMA